MKKQTIRKHCNVCKRSHYDNVGCIRKKEVKRNPLSNDYITKDAEPIDWFTSRGKKVPIFKGQSKNEAFQNAKKNFGTKKGGKKAEEIKKKIKERGLEKERY